MPLSRQTSLNEAPSAIRSQTFSANSGVYRVSVTFDFSPLIVFSSRAHTARLNHFPPAWCASWPIGRSADGALDGARIVAAQAVQKAASDQRVDVGFGHLDRIAPEAAVAALAKPRHPDP